MIDPEFQDWQGRKVQLVTISSYKDCMSKYIFQDFQDFLLSPMDITITMDILFIYNSKDNVSERIISLETVCRLDLLQVPRGHCGKKHLLHRQKRLLSFQNEQLFVFNDKQSTQYHKKTSFIV